MDLGTLAAIGVPVVGGFVWVLTGVARMSRAQESVSRDVADARSSAARANERIDSQDSRLVTLETGRAVDEERWKRVEAVMQEVRDDVKSIKAAKP